MNLVGQWCRIEHDVDALLIPTAVPIHLPQGTDVQIVQALGGNLTINVSGNLARIDAKDASALGIEIKEDAPMLCDEDYDGPVEVSQIWDQLRTCYDPEIPVNIVDLGLIYDCSLESNPDGGHIAHIKMTLTAPGCGMGPVIVDDVKNKCGHIPGVKSCEVELVFDPPWDRSMMSEGAQLQLGML